MKYIDKLLENTTELSKERGEVIFDSELVIKQKISDKSFSTIVSGVGDDYKVTISNFDSSSIKAKCSCPYNWDGNCKHIFASALELKEHLRLKSFEDLQMDREFLEGIRTIFGGELPSELQSDNSLAKKKNTNSKAKKRGPNDPLHVRLEESDFQNKYFERWDWTTPTIRSIRVNKKAFEINVNELYVYGSHLVDLYCEKDSFYINCDCERRNKPVCEHESFVLTVLSRSNFDYSSFLNSNEDERLSFYGGKFGCPPELVNSKNVAYEFDTEFNLNYKFKNKLLNFVTTEVLTQNNWDTILVPHKSVEKLKSTYSVTVEPNRRMALVLEIQDEMIHPLCISGRITKCGTKLATKIEVINDANRKFIPMTSEEKKLYDFCRTFPVDEFYTSWIDPDEMLRLLHQLWQLIDEKTILYYKSGFCSQNNPLRKQNLEHIKLDKHFPELRFKIKENNYLIDSKISVFLNGKKLKNSQIIPINSYMFEYEESCVLLKDASQIDIFSNFDFLKKLSVGKDDKKYFVENFIANLAKQHTVSCDFIDRLDGNFVKQILYIDESETHLIFTPVVEYQDGMTVDLLDKGNVFVCEDRQIVRDKELEKKFLDVLIDSNPEWEEQRHAQSAFTVHMQEVFYDDWFYRFFEDLKEAGVILLGFSNLKKFRYSPHVAEVDYKVESNQDWFEAKVSIAFGDTIVSIKDLKKHLISGGQYIELSDGSMGVIPEKWINKLNDLIRVGTIKDDVLKISKMRFTLIDELFDNIDQSEIIEELIDKRNRIKQFDKIEETLVPATVNATLRPYQLSGLNWLNFLDEFKWGGILADDMGLGKTLQMLTFLAQQKEKGAGTSLVIVPTTLIFNWQNEVQKFCPNLKVLVHYSGSREKDHSHFSEYDIVLSTYGLLVNDIKILTGFKFNYAVLDESQAIKNVSSQRYKAALLLKAQSKLALTGTPIENNTFDLYAQMNFANPGFLGTAAAFKRDFATAIDKDRNQEAAAQLQKMINPFLIRRTKEEVATELPSKTEDVIYCTMEEEQRKVYDAYRNKYRDYLQGKVAEDGLEKSKLYVLEGLTKLRQICDSPLLIDGGTNQSVKINELVRHIKNKTANHKIVVFSQFVSMLELIKEQLDNEKISYEYLDGSTTQKNRKKNVDHFQEDESCRVFLISLKAGGTGLNLTAADYVFLVDPWWNPAVENQAIDRCYRIGQTKKVFAYRMICKDTIEEKIVRHQQRKKDVAADLIQTEQSFMKDLTSDQLSDLFS